MGCFSLESMVCHPAQSADPIEAARVDLAERLIARLERRYRDAEDAALSDGSVGSHFRREIWLTAIRDVVFEARSAGLDRVWSSVL